MGPSSPGESNLEPEDWKYWIWRHYGRRANCVLKIEPVDESLEGAVELCLILESRWEKRPLRLSQFGESGASFPPSLHRPTISQPRPHHRH